MTFFFGLFFPALAENFICFVLKFLFYCMFVIHNEYISQGVRYLILIFLAFLSFLIPVFLPIFIKSTSLSPIIYLLFCSLLTFGTVTYIDELFSVLWFICFLKLIQVTKYYLYPAWKKLFKLKQCRKLFTKFRIYLDLISPCCWIKYLTKSKDAKGKHFSMNKTAISSACWKIKHINSSEDVK